MKTEMKSKIQDSGKQNARLGCESNATPTTQSCICGTTPDQTDRSGVSYPSDSPSPAATPAEPMNPTIRSSTYPNRAARSRSIQPYLGLSRLKKNSPRSSLSPAIPVGRGRSQSEPSPVLFVRRRALINFLIPGPPGSPSASVAKLQSRFVAKYPETRRLQNHPSRDISRFVKVCREINQNTSAVAINREMNSPARRRRSHEALINSDSSFCLHPSCLRWVAAEVMRQTFASAFICVPQGPTSFGQGYASLSKATQAPRKNSPASLACKASLLRPVAIRPPFARLRNIRKLQSGNVRNYQETSFLKNQPSQEMSGFVRKYQVSNHNLSDIGNYQESLPPVHADPHQPVASLALRATRSFRGQQFSFEFCLQWKMVPFGTISSQNGTLLRIRLAPFVPFGPHKATPIVIKLTERAEAAISLSSHLIKCI
jgi:hypothetical protein